MRLRLPLAVLAVAAAALASVPTALGAVRIGETTDVDRIGIRLVDVREIVGRSGPAGPQGRPSSGFHVDNVVEIEPLLNVGQASVVEVTFANSRSGRVIAPTETTALANLLWMPHRTDNAQTALGQSYRVIRSSRRSRLLFTVDDISVTTINSRACSPLPAGVDLGAATGNGIISKACYDDEGGGRVWLVQAFRKSTPDFGGEADAGPYDVYVSTWPVGASGLYADAPQIVSDANQAQQDVLVPATYVLPTVGVRTFAYRPDLLAYPRWSKFSPGGYQGYLKGKHFPLLFGSLSVGALGVYGPGNRAGAPTTVFGRNVYIDTLDSDYGAGWRRIMGVLAQPPNGSFCYEIAKKGGSKGKTGESSKNRYRLTAIGPGLLPVVAVEVPGPTFEFGAPGYDAKTMKWGTGFSDEQTKALRDQAALIGPGYRTKPKGKGSTDCGETLRQLPEAFLLPPPA